MTKNWRQFREHDSVEQMQALLAEAESRGVEHGPSNYGDLFHQLNRSPPCQAHVKKLFPAVPGGWEMVIVPGPTTQPLFQYALRSASLWSLSQSLPSPHSFTTVRRVRGPGLYLVSSPANPVLPYPWSATGQFPATEDEISRFNLPWRQVSRGIAFEPGTWTCGPWETSIREWSCWKAVARAFWGRWASHGRTKQTTYTRDGKVSTESEVRDPTGNPIWAALITSRIRLKLWDVCWRQPVQRVYVDSVVTTAPLEEGDKIGDWREVRYYPKGGFVGLAGVRGDVELRRAA